VILKLTLTSVGDEGEHIFINTHYIEFMRWSREHERTRIWLHDPGSGRIRSYDVEEFPESIQDSHNASLS
jgi:hypothetical protein